MIIVVKLFYALCLAAGGILIIKYRKRVYEWTGRIAWAEKWLGSGGTVIFITLIGLLLMFLSVTYPFGVFDKFIKNENSINSQNGN